MGILTRIFNLFRATTSDLLDKAEDPEKMIKQMISDLEAQKKKSKGANDRGFGFTKTFGA